MHESTQILRYTTGSPTPDEQGAEPTSADRAMKVFSWTILTVCITLWAVLGALFWIPLLLRRLIAFSGALLFAMLREKKPTKAARKLRSAMRFYGRGFQVATEMVTRDAERTERGRVEPADDPPRLSGLLGEMAWAVLVWYAIALAVGLVATPAELWQGLLALPWGERVADPVMGWVRTHRP